MSFCVRIEMNGEKNHTNIRQHVPAIICCRFLTCASSCPSAEYSDRSMLLFVSDSLNGNDVRISFTSSFRAGWARWAYIIRGITHFVRRRLALMMMITHIRGPIELSHTLESTHTHTPISFIHAASECLYVSYYYNGA